MSIILRLPQKIEREMRADLMRPHPFAFERVGFVFTRLSRSPDTGQSIILALDYQPVPDAEYIDDPYVGARINAAAIRRAMQHSLTTGQGAFHVHIHDHRGFPALSGVDQEELRPIMSSIRNASAESAHGLLVLSADAAYAEALLPRSSRFNPASKVTVVGLPSTILVGEAEEVDESSRFSRQSFLGADAERSIASCRVGIVGLGGGGSHVVQQLAHVGFTRFSLFDNDTVEDTNLNRLVGATEKDAKRNTPKVEVAARLIEGVNPHAVIDQVRSRWQDAPDKLHACDILFGCVDSFAERRDIEIAARRYLIPYLDIGLDVNKSGDEPPRMAGQVILSMPGDLCMSCMGFLTETKLAREAERYGAAGPRAQVVWANGVLASTAVGLAVDLITDWSCSLRKPVYLSYDSNAGRVQPHKRLDYIHNQMCAHFPLSQVGDPVFKQL